jgi:hypothetical protein
MNTLRLDQADYQPLMAPLILGKVRMNLAGHPSRRDQEGGRTVGALPRNHLLRLAWTKDHEASVAGCARHRQDRRLCFYSLGPKISQKHLEGIEGHADRLASLISLTNPARGAQPGVRRDLRRGERGLLPNLTN